MFSRMKKWRKVTWRLALISTAACAAIVGAVAVAGSSRAQQTGPPTGTLELVSLNGETRFAFVDNPPRRRERAGDLFVINARLRDTSNRPAGRVHASFAETQPPPRVVAQGSGTFILRNGQVMVSGPIVDRGRNDRTDTLAVVGGTGAYTGARGTLVTTDMRRSTRYVFTFVG
jgi:Dirigent-like protein